MTTVLAIDRGNDSLKAALFSEGLIAERIRLAEGDPGDALDLIRRVRPDGIAVSCVVPAWRAAVEAALSDEPRAAILWAGHGSPLPFSVDVADPAAVGPDRLCAVAGVVGRGIASAVVVDAGTAVTVDVLKEGEFIGGSIMPGLDLMLRSLGRGTAVLPSLDSSQALASSAGTLLRI